MSYTFVGASAQYLSTTTTPVTAPPFSVAVWFQVVSTTVGSTLFSLGASGDDFINRYQITPNSDGSMSFTANGGSASFAVAGSIAAANTWYHGGGVSSSTSSRIAYFNGVPATANTATVTPTAIDSIRIGTRAAATTPKFDGKVAEIAIWDFGLTDAEMAALAKGYSPLFIKPENLRFYAPLVRNLQDIVEARAITNTNTATVGNHPRIIMPWQRQRRIAVTAPTFKAGWAVGSNIPVLGTGTY